MDCAQRYGYYDEMAAFLRSLFGRVLKSNPCLKFAVLSGCLRIAKESLFPGLNNLQIFGLDDDVYAPCFGFTPAEVDSLLEQYGFSEKKSVIRKWYGGYRFGADREMYCPWDITMYLSDLLAGRTVNPKPYWSHTAGHQEIRKMIENSSEPLRKDLENLLDGGAIRASISEKLTYDEMFSSQDNLWSMLYLTGYLTKVPGQPYPLEGQADLAIPNKEVREIMLSCLAGWAKDLAGDEMRHKLTEAFWAGDSEIFTSILSCIAEQTVSIHDWQEYIYHFLLLGLLYCDVPDFKSNRESGDGRPGILILDNKNGRAAVIEIKRARKKNEMHGLADRALLQIREKNYASPLTENYHLIFCWGIAFHGKQCLARCSDNPVAAPGRKLAPAPSFTPSPFSR